MNLSNDLATSLSFMDKGIEFAQSKVHSAISEKVSYQAKESLKKLQENLTSVKTFHYYISKFSSNISKKLASLILSFFFKKIPMIKNQTSLVNFKVHTNQRLKYVATQELKETVTKHLENFIYKNRAKGKTNDLQTIFHEQEFTEKLLKDSESLSNEFTFEEKLRMLKSSLVQSLKKYITIDSSVEFHIEKIISQVQFNKLISQIDSSTPPVIYIDPQLLTASQKANLIMHIKKQLEATTKFITLLSHKIEKQPHLQLQVAKKTKAKDILEKKLIDLQFDYKISFVFNNWYQIKTILDTDSMLSLVNVKENSELRTIIDNRDKRETTLLILSKEIIPIPDLNSLSNNLVPIHLKKQMINNYLIRFTQQKKDKISLIEANYAAILSKWLKDTDNPPIKIIQMLDTQIKKRLEKINLEVMLKSPVISQDERDLLYLNETMLAAIEPEVRDRQILPEIQQLTANYTIFMITKSNSIKRYANFMKNLQLIESDFTESIKSLKALTFKAKSLINLQANLKIADKATKTIRKYEEGEVILPQDKLSLQEFGILEDLKKISDHLNDLALFRYAPENPKLAEIIDLTNKSAELYKRIEEVAVAQASEIYPSGAIALTDPDYQVAMRRYGSNYEERMTRIFVSHFTHAAKIYVSDKDQKACISHIYGTYENDGLSLRDLLINKYFSINPIKLLKPEVMAKLDGIESGAENFLLSVQDKYEEIERSIHEDSQENFINLANNEEACFKAGYAKFGFVTKVESRIEDDRMNALRDKIITPNTYADGSTMICSEFAALTTTAAFKILDEWIEEQLKLKDIILVKDKSGLNAINLPVQNNRRYETIHPEEIVTLYSAADAITPLDRPAILNALIAD